MSTGTERTVLPNGTIVAGYRIDGVLGEGGMGVVYRATQLSLNRVVALKLLAGDLSDDPGFRTRFQREGQLQAALDHAHIVSVYEAGQTAQGLFMAMRLIDGPTLKDLIVGGGLDPRRALRLLAQVAQALDAAHATGLIHRDIKPQNILIGRNDHAYLADFGLIKAPDDPDRLTGTGQFIGTIDYVAPEQIQGEPASAASDTYALTGVLYECLSGHVPFERPSEAAVLHAHIMAERPRLTDARPELPVAIDEVIAAGMARDPAARPASATELVRAATRAFSGGGPQVAAPAQPTRIVPTPGERSQTTRVPVGAAAASAPPLAPGHAKATRAADAPVTDGPAGSATVSEDAGAGASGGTARTVPRPRAPVRGPRAALALGVVAVLALAAVAVGFLVGHSGSSSSSSATASFTNLATVGHLSVRYPPEFQLGSTAASIPGMTLSDPIALARSGGLGALDAGTVDAGGPTLLPAGFRAALAAPLPSASPVTLGSVQALRYSGLHLRGTTAPLTVYAIPTTAGVATIACAPASAAAAAKLQPECDQVAGTLRLVGTTAYPLGASTAYAHSLATIFTQLRSATSGSLASLSSAATPSAQASASDALAHAYSAAAGQVSGITASPMVRDANDAIVAALHQVAGGYAAAAAAARANDGGAYTRAGQTVSAGNAALARGVQALTALGYSVGRT